MSKGMVTVIDKISLRAGKRDEVKKIYDDWCVFIAQMPGYASIEMLCLTDERIVWVEKWNSKETLDAFHMEHMTLSDFSIRMLECAKTVHERVAYQELK